MDNEGIKEKIKEDLEFVEELNVFFASVCVTELPKLVFSGREYEGLNQKEVTRHKVLMY